MNRQLDGRRVRLVECLDPFALLMPGDTGTILTTDSTGTVHVRWDSGSRLGLIPGLDRFVVVPDHIPGEE